MILFLTHINSFNAKYFYVAKRQRPGMDENFRREYFGERAEGCAGVGRKSKRKIFRRLGLGGCLKNYNISLEVSSAR